MVQWAVKCINLACLAKFQIQWHHEGEVRPWKNLSLCHQELWPVYCVEQHWWQNGIYCLQPQISISSLTVKRNMINSLVHNFMGEMGERNCIKTIQCHLSAVKILFQIHHLLQIEYNFDGLHHPFYPTECSDASWSYIPLPIFILAAFIASSQVFSFLAPSWGIFSLRTAAKPVLTHSIYHDFRVFHLSAYPYNPLQFYSTVAGTHAQGEFVV